MLKESFIFCLLGVLTYAVLADYSANTAPHSTSLLGYHKTFYYFSAPEEKFDHSEELQKRTSPGAIKKNLRVIVIKPPAQKSYENAVRHLASNVVEAPNEQIYVLQRQPDYASLTNQIQSTQQTARQHNRPDVHYVKFRQTAEPEAHYAQQTQAQQQYADPDDPIASESVRYEAYVAPPSPTDAVPVDKSYARNFLPTGIDVTPGSSYIP